MKKWKIALIAIGVIVANSVVGCSTDVDNSTSPTSVEISATENAETEKSFKESCSTIDAKTLARNPDKHKGENYKMTGEVTQVQESTLDNTVELKITVGAESSTEITTEYNSLTGITTARTRAVNDIGETIYATVEISDGEDRILRNDTITFWGTCDGLYRYTDGGTSVSSPKIDIKYFELESE